MEDSNYNPDDSYGANVDSPQLNQTARQQQYQRAQQQVREWYRNELGREPSDAEVDSHLGGDYGDDSYMRRIYSNIYLSPEGVEYRNRRGSAGTETTTTTTTTDSGPNLSSAGAQRLRAAYKQYLGRDASDDEIRSWLSGSYGWGTGEQGVDAMIQGIATSGEAQEYKKRTPTPPGGTGGTGTTTTPRVTTTMIPRPTVAAPSSTSGVAGVPPSYAAMPSAAKSTIGGTIPTLADAVAQAKQYLPAAPQFQRPGSAPEISRPGVAPEINKPGPFAAPTPAWAEDRNRVVQAILKQPEVMGQSFQDALFEQQKEQQAQMAAQARSRLSQTTAARGLSAAGGQELLGQAGIEEGFINNLLAARRDVSTKAAEANRASSLAAIEMANAVEQGDFARAQAAYETQLRANQIYDQLRQTAYETEVRAQQAYDQSRLAAYETDLRAQQAYDQLRLQAAEMERSNVALAAQNLLAQREMERGEQSQSFDQYLRQLQMNEMIRQFNEQLALSYGKFGWEQQIGLAGLFPGS